MPTKGWKETAPWKRKFRFSVKVNIYLKPCICLISENVNIENEGAAGKIFLNFWNLALQNEKMDREWTDLSLRDKTNPLIGQHPLPPNLESKIFWTSPKTQNSDSPLNLSGGCTIYSPDNTIFHACPHDRFMEIQSNVRRKKLHWTIKAPIFLEAVLAIEII